MSDSKPVNITLPPLRITLTDEQQITLEWLTQNLGNLASETKKEIPDNLRRWMAINKLLNQPEDGIIQMLVKMGVDANLATEEVRGIASHPYFQICNNFVQLLQKMESQLQIQTQLAALSSKFGTIERKSNLSRAEFLENYYAKNTPVILTNAMSNWPALHLWNPNYLKQKYGHATVEIQSNRESDPEYEINLEKHKQTVLFSKYVDMVASSGESNNYYMVANNQNLEREEFKSLFDDIDIFSEYLNPADTSGRAFFWFGPAGTITPLHHDPVNLILAQVLGRKRVRMISPERTPLMYNYVGVFSKVDGENPDFEKYPLYRNVKILEFILEPGEALFIPVGWWHHVKSLDVSISVSFTNFIFPNYYEWKYPHVQW
ncbi:cupin-like domain-containing protein [Kamptonema sp. UHCC 0994]|uniref:cupin-like domain-containing protein n=1 Tax=Kamptonema sp. UHCC 0994 TaxID=3031329 RepID=UPI0023B9FB47|nr:cupin-like domain-containing protein [Kamptonema sp. UHCC 0994]MDF0556040.1 cupin-like domain-containing protein [Kamptonema sp. UHCC 0994]